MHIVLVGFSSAILADLPLHLPDVDVTVLEEPEIVERRDVVRRVSGNPRVSVVPVPVHARPDADLLPRRVQRPPGAVAVVPATEYGVVGAAVLADAWGLPGAGTHAAAALRNKVHLRALAGRAGIAQPVHRVVTCVADIDTFRRETGRACVVKPVDRQGSVGVHLLDDGDPTPDPWAELGESDEERRLRATHLEDTFLVEQRLVGPEVSVECLVRSGRVVFRNLTSKRLFDGSRPVERGHTVPAALDADVTTAVDLAMDRLIGATGFRDGVLHAEWILVDGRRPHLVECAGRLPGDSIDTLIDRAYGGSLLDDLVTTLRGERVDRGPATQAAAIEYVEVPRDGVVAEVRGLESVRSAPHVLEAELRVGPGDVVGVVRSSVSRVGHVMVVAADAREATRLAQHAAASVEVVVA